MKLAGFLAIFALTIGLSLFVLRPDWLEHSDQLRELWRTATSASLQAAAEQPQDPGAAIDQLRQQLLEYLESQLRSGTTGTQEQSTEIGRYVQRMMELRTQVRDSDGTSERSLLHALFAAAKVCPADYRAPFEQLVEQTVTDTADDDIAAEARVLEFLVKHPLQTVVTQDVVNDLREFARSYPRSAWGISLFSAASSRLWLAKQAESAEQVLTMGLQMYEQHPGRVELVKQLIDQGHRPPPKCQISEAEYWAKERAVDKYGMLRPPVKG